MAETSKAGVALATATAASILTYLITKATTARAAPPEGVTIFTPDEDTWNLLLGLLAGVVSIDKKLDAAIAALGGEVTLENPEHIGGGVVICPVIGQAVPLPPREIPWDKEVIIKAFSTNGGTIRVGNSKPDAENPGVGYPLIGNEAIGYKVKELSQLWICATVANEGANWTVEQK